MPTVRTPLQQEVGEVQVVVGEAPLDAVEGVAPLLVVGDHGGVRFLVERVQEAALRGARAEPVIELGRPRHRSVDVFGPVHHPQAGSKLLADPVLVGERERAEGARRVFAGDEVLDVIRDFERAFVDVGPSHGRMRHTPGLKQLGEVQEAAHPAGVRAAMDLEQELLSAGGRQHVRVMRSPPQPRLDADSGERAARDLVGRLGDLLRRGRDGERAHWPRRI